MIFRARACSARKNASVTTKDGMPSLDTSVPSTRPMAAPHAMPAMVATHQGWSCLMMNQARTVAQAPPATPADRSISPRSSTNTMPMARTMMDEAWMARLAML